MRPHLAVAALLAVSLVATVAFAASGKVDAQFQSFAASGVSGTATLNEMPTGEVQIHASLRGLQPNTEYVAVIYDQSLTCGEGTSSLQIIQFDANPAGVATWNQKVARGLATIQSIGIRFVPDNSLKACATVTQ